ncbi:hypothetical protein LSAT2_022866, partial [Lamellibrachia satsuma]
AGVEQNNILRSPRRGPHRYYRRLYRPRPSYTTPQGEQGPLTPHRREHKALLHHTAGSTRPSYTTPQGEQGSNDDWQAQQQGYSERHRRTCKPSQEGSNSGRQGDQQK